MANQDKSDLTPEGEQIIGYDSVLAAISSLLEASRRAAAHSTNAIMTVTYWQIGRYIVELEQSGKERAEYGERVIARLSADLTSRFGRGFGVVNLTQMRNFYLTWNTEKILQTVSEESEIQASSIRFPLSWSQYVRLLSVKNLDARAFYEAEALRGGWSVRQLNRQINTMFYERTLLSKNKAAMLTKGAAPKQEDTVTAEEEIKDPFILEFLGLKDEYSESELEEALIRHLESFLLELGNDFTFVARQKRIRIGDEWFRMDLLLYHRRLRCLVIIDLKVGKFSYADAGQMNLYVNYAAEHLTLPDENPPVGLILCSEPNAAVAHYALNRLHNNILTAQYRLVLPDEITLTSELERTRKLLEARRSTI